MSEELPGSADLLTNASNLLTSMREQERQLENDLAAMGARLETTRQIISALTGKPRAKRIRSRPSLPDVPDPQPLDDADQEMPT